MTLDNKISNDDTRRGTDEDAPTLDISAAPTSPGCYLMRNERGQILYVGKAKNLRARLRNYINETDSRYSVKFLMRRVASIEYLVVDTEKEALLLENSLIKAHKPKYNVRLRDDKTYISIRLDPRETFPRLRVVRRHKEDGARYFGPYHDTRAARKTLKQMQKLVPLRICSNHVMANRTRPCIYYQMKQCAAPCVGLVAPEAYARLVEQALLILEGRSAELEQQLLDGIAAAAGALKFEEAAVLRDRLHDLRATVEPQRAVTSGVMDERDVFGVHVEGRFIEIQVLFYRGNTMVGGEAFSFDHVETPVAEILASFLLQFYSVAPVIPKEVLLPVAVDDQDALAELLSEKRGGRVALRCPRRGALKRIVALANDNAKRAFTDRRGQEKAIMDTLEQTRAALHLSRIPERIECFDVSTIQGSNTVAAMVVFEHGLPAKQRYRRYAVKNISGQDDFSAMREALERRYRRAVAEDELPDLVLIDGGKGHLNVALAVLKSLGLAALPCAAIAKSRVGEGTTSFERFFIPGRMNPIVPPQRGPVVQLLSRVRDEAHRFAIGYHRIKRKKSTITTALLDIPGVGPTLARRLLTQFGSLTRVRQATVEQLARTPGIHATLAQQIHEALKEKR